MTTNRKSGASVRSSELLGLTVTKRSDNFHCCKTGCTAEWDCGRTEAEAVGNWLRTHGPDNGIVIAWHNDSGHLRTTAGRT